MPAERGRPVSYRDALINKFSDRSSSHVSKNNYSILVNNSTSVVNDKSCSYPDELISRAKSVANSSEASKSDAVTMIGNASYDVGFREFQSREPIILNVEIGDKIYEALVDTGASVSVINYDVVKSISCGIHRRGQCTPINVCLSVGERSSFQLKEFVEIQFKLEGKTMLYRFYVMPNLTNEIILGMDWLTDQQALVDVLNKSILLNPKVKRSPPLSLPDDKDSTLSFGAIETMTVYCKKFTYFSPDANSIVKFNARVPDGDYLFEPNKTMQLKKLMLFPHAVITIRNGKGFTYAVNPMKERKFLVKSTQLGSLVPVNSPIVPVENKKLSSIQIHNAVANVDDLKINHGPNLTCEQKKQLFALIKDYRHCFANSTAEMGRTELITHTINTGDSQPIRSNCYRYSFEERNELKSKINELMEEGILEPSSSPWASPAVFARKKDGTLRLCVDYRKLNAVTKKDVYPLPRIDDSLDRLANTKFFTSLDLFSGYHQVAMNDEDKEKTAVITPDGLYQYNVLPFGLCNAPATFQRLVDRLFHRMKWTSILVYLDDLVVFGSSFEEHQSRLKDVFEALSRAKLTLKPSKCVFAHSELKYLGHVISTEGVSVDPEKISAVENFPVPISKTHVRSFLGLAGYYRRFIENFALIAEPLSRLTRNNAAFLWTDEQQTAFEKLKRKLTSMPILAYYQQDAPTAIHSDASGHGMGAVLTQIQNKKEVVIAYASQKFSDTEKRYSTTERELLAVVWAIRKFRPYIFGRPFDVVTDHHSLCSALKLSEPNDRICKWVTYLQQYNLTVKYKSGAKHLDADGLSRSPLDEAGEVKSVSLWALQTMDLKTEQLKDSTLKPIITSLRNVYDNEEPPLKSIKNLHDYCLMDSILYKANYNYAGRLWLLCIPESMQAEVIRSVHEDPTGGHLGLHRTLATVRSRFYWPQMIKTVRRFLLGCQKCQAFNRRVGKPPGLMQEYEEPSRPFQRVGVDYVGPFVSSHHKNTHIFVMVDHLTRYVEAVPVTAATGKNAMRALRSHIFYRHSIPETIVEDQGREFLSSVYKDELSRLGVKCTRTSPYHPQTNGMTERFNGTLKKIISKYVADDHKDWDEWVQAAVHAYNTSIHDVTNYAPHYLLYGKEPILPIDLCLPVLHDRVDDNAADQCHDRIEVALDEAKMKSKKARRKNKQRYDQHHTEVRYESGDLVWRYTPKRVIGLSEKLLPHWSGPYEIVGQLTPVTYWVKDHRTNMKRKRRKPFYVHVAHLKPYVPEVPNGAILISSDEDSADSSVTARPPTVTKPVRSSRKSKSSNEQTWDWLQNSPCKERNVIEESSESESEIRSISESEPIAESSVNTRKRMTNTERLLAESKRFLNDTITSKTRARSRAAYMSRSLDFD